jgi:MFS family permease
MTSLTPSPLYVALVQTATYLPVLLIGLPAGAIADIFDRRKVLLVTQAWMTVAAGLLAFSTWFGFTGRLPGSANTAPMPSCSPG